MEKDFNNLGPWLRQKLVERNMSVEDLARVCKPRLSRRVIYMWMEDEVRPGSMSMTRVCHALSQIPVVAVDGSKTLVPVPTEEAFAQYTERKNGRPKGGGAGSPKAVTVRTR